MKNVNLNKIVSTACLLSLLSTSITVAGPEDDQFDIPASSIRRGPSVGNVEKLTFEDGQFTATVDGNTHTIMNYDVDKSIRNIINNNRLTDFLNADGKLLIGQLKTADSEKTDYTISDGSGLKGGFLPIVGAVAARVVLQVATKELAKAAAKRAAKAAAKSLAKKVATKAALATPAFVYKGCQEYNKASKEYRNNKKNKKNKKK